MTTMRDLVHSWIEAFNTRDLRGISSLCHDDIVFVSPIVRQVTAGQKSELIGRSEVEELFARGLKIYPELKFTLAEIFEGAMSVCLKYHTTAGDRTVCEYMEVDGDRLVRKIVAHFA